jgi:hypothetical protein
MIDYRSDEINASRKSSGRGTGARWRFTSEDAVFQVHLLHDSRYTLITQGGVIPVMLKDPRVRGDDARTKLPGAL